MGGIFMESRTETEKELLNIEKNIKLSVARIKKSEQKIKKLLQDLNDTTDNLISILMTNTKEQKCLLEEARKRAIEEHGERGKSMPLYISCPCPRCSPRY